MQYIIMTLCLLMGAQAFAANAAAHLADILEKHRTYSANFSGRMLDGGEEGMQEMRGKVAFQRPGRFSWIQTEPDTMELVADGRRIWSYDPILAQVIVKAQDAIILDTPVALLAGDAARWLRKFEVQRLSVEECRHSECFVLRPREAESTFVILYMHFDSGILAEIQFQDVFERHTQLNFSHPRVNQAIPADTFVFQIPEGVDILESD